MTDKPETEDKKDTLHKVLTLYRESVKNVPLLKYSWVLIATVCILTIAAYFRQNNSDVFFYAIGVLIISFLGFVFSLMLKIKDIVIRIALYLLIYCIIFTMGASVLGFASFIYRGEPRFYERWFPEIPKSDSTSYIIKTDRAVQKTPEVIKQPDSTKREPEQKQTKDTARLIEIVKDGFHQVNNETGYYLYKGHKISFKKVIGNHTKLPARISPYYISDPVTNAILIDYANQYPCRTKVPSKNSSTKPITSICAEDAFGISQQLGLDIPDLIQIINADMSGEIKITSSIKDIFIDKKDSLAALGVIYIDTIHPNWDTKYYSDRDYNAKILPAYYCPTGRFRLIKILGNEN